MQTLKYPISAQKTSPKQNLCYYMVMSHGTTRVLQLDYGTYRMMIARL